MVSRSTWCVLTLSILLVAQTPSVASSTPRSLKSKTSPIKLVDLLSYEELTDTTNKQFLCSNVGTARRANWQSGAKVKKTFVSDKINLDALKLKKKELAKKKQKLSKKEANTLKRLTERMNMCKSFGRDPNAFNPLPVAYNSNHVSKSIDPVSVALNVVAGKPGLALSCHVTETGQGATVEVHPNCKLLVKPKDHRVGGVHINFYATQEGDSRQSNIATATVSWDQSEEFNGDYLSVAPYRDTLTHEEAMHLIRWAGLGSNRANLLELASQQNGRELLINELTTPKDCAAVEAEALSLARSYFDGNYRDIIVNKFEDGRDENNDNKPDTVYSRYTYYTNDEQPLKEFWSNTAIAVYEIYLLKAGCEPLRERLALLFNNHFSLTLMSGNHSPIIARDSYYIQYLNLIRGKRGAATGLFPNLLSMVSNLHSDGAMLMFLDNRGNRWDRATNENYARELMELFTLGERDIVTQGKNYNEKDIYEMSYALTGYTEQLVDDPRIPANFKLCCKPDIKDGVVTNGCFASNRCISVGHEKYDARYKQKNVPAFLDTMWNDIQRPQSQYLFKGAPWEQYGVFKANSVGDSDNLTPYLMNQHPGVARYFSARFMASFAGLELTDETVSELATQLKADGFNFDGILRKILGSSSYFSEEARHDCVSAPVETLMSFLNLMDLPLNNPSGLYSILIGNFRDSGQTFLSPITVFGWKECGKITGNVVHNGEFWLGTQLWLERLNGITNYLSRVNSNLTNLNYNWQNLLPESQSDRRNPAAIVDHFAYKLGTKLTEPERDIMIEYLSNISTGNTISEEDGSTIPDLTKVQPVNLPTLSTAEFNSYWTQKGPGLIELFYGLKVNNLK